MVQSASASLIAGLSIADRVRKKIFSYRLEPAAKTAPRNWGNFNRSRSCGSGRLGDGCLESLSTISGSADFQNSVALIDVLWIGEEKTIVAAFEVEHSTSIYSGVLRLLDLAHSEGGRHLTDVYLVAPDKREDEIKAQVLRPAFKKMNGLTVRYLSYSELAKHKDSVLRFGSDLKAIQALSKVMN